MEKILGFVGVLFLAALVLAAAMYVVPIAVGIVGFLMVKTKVPLVNPKGPVVVPIIYALAWAASITLGLFAGTVLLHAAGWSAEQWPLPRKLAFARSVAEDAKLFFVEMTFILLATVQFAGSSLARRNINLASAASCGVASFLLTFSPTLPWTDFSALTIEVGRRAMETIISPITVVMELVGGIEPAVAKLRDWLWGTYGNLFAVMSALSKVLWVAALIQLGRGIISRPSAQARSEPGTSLSGAELKRLAVTVVLVAAIGAILWVRESYEHVDVFFMWALVLFATYVALIWSLWSARSQSGHA